MTLGRSELVLNPDGSVYHLNLLPEDLAKTIITVGDPERVKQVSRFFDRIEVQKSKREFKTCTGTYKGRRISVISTGIGTDNIDIVLNELDALVNIDLVTRTVKKDLKRLDIIRIGTSGAIQSDIPVDSFLLSEHAIGLDGLLHYYQTGHMAYGETIAALVNHTSWATEKPLPYMEACDAELAKALGSNRIRFGCTITNTGFYGPQGRVLRLPLADIDLQDRLVSFQHQGIRLTNLEMETSAIYALSKMMGHRAVSMNCILANRITGDFSQNPKKAMDSLIQYTLDRVSTTP
ncbi:MAG: nucleoside phosphorylase [Flavobacteriaceae bacterium]